MLSNRNERALPGMAARDSKKVQVTEAYLAFVLPIVSFIVHYFDG